jgi:hypothetical protein
MNCELCQRRLLADPDPNNPAADVAAHLADCPACREGQRRLTFIEDQVARLPVPPSDAMAPFIQHLVHEPLPFAPPATQPLRRPAWRRLTLGLGGMAAALAVMAGGVLLGSILWRSLHGNRETTVAAKSEKKADLPAMATNAATGTPSSGAGALVDRVMDCDLRLAQAATPRQRVETLADLADALRDEAQALGQASAPEVLDSVAQLYGKVIREGVVQRSRAVPIAQRREVLDPIAARLARTGRAMEGVAQKVAPAAAMRLRLVATTAQEADAQLRALVQGVAP